MLKARKKKTKYIYIYISKWRIQVARNQTKETGNNIVGPNGTYTARM